MEAFVLKVGEHFLRQYYDQYNSGRFLFEKNTCLVYCTVFDSREKALKCWVDTVEQWTMKQYQEFMGNHEIKVFRLTAQEDMV